MHKNLDKVEQFEANIFAVSKDRPNELKLLSDALKTEFPKEDHREITFLSDPDLHLIDYMGMKDGDTAFRGFGLLSETGEVIFVEKNDHWGEELDKTLDSLTQKYKEIQKD